jgi:hypothetical protein
LTYAAAVSGEEDAEIIIVFVRTHGVIAALKGRLDKMIGSKRANFYSSKNTL